MHLCIFFTSVLPVELVSALELEESWCSLFFKICMEYEIFLSQIISH